MGNRFERSQRLVKSEQFEVVFAARMSTRATRMTVYGRPNGLEEGRLGLTVGRKVATRAVVRNYMKRVLREVFRSAPAIFRGADWVVVLQRAFDRHARAEVQAELLGLAETLRRRWRASSSS